MKYENLNLLSLNLTGAWFDLINGNEKKNEYRTVEKWKKRVEPLFKDFENGKPLYLCLYRGYTKICIMVKCTSITVKNGLETDLKTDEYVYDFAFEKVFELVPNNRKTINKDFLNESYKLHFRFFEYLDKISTKPLACIRLSELQTIMQNVILLSETYMHNNISEYESFQKMLLIAKNFGLPSEHRFFNLDF